MVIETIIERGHFFEFTDLAAEPQSLFAKPDQTLVEVLTLMKDEKIDILPVFDNGIKIGVVTIWTIIENLVGIFQNMKVNYQMAIHDLRCPIYNVQALIDLLASTNIEKNQQQLIEFCKISCKQSINVLEDLLHLEVHAEISDELTEVEMNDFYRQCLNELRGLATSKNLTIVNEISTEKVTREINQKTVKRAIHNIIANAIKFSYPKGIIKVSSDYKNGQLVLKVSDAGMGIPIHQQPLVFNKFSAARRQGTSGEPASGLGLFAARKYIEANHGTVSFKSIEGKGSKFYIRF